MIGRQLGCTQGPWASRDAVKASLTGQPEPLDPERKKKGPPVGRARVNGSRSVAAGFSSNPRTNTGRTGSRRTRSLRTSTRRTRSRRKRSPRTGTIRMSSPRTSSRCSNSRPSSPRRRNRRRRRSTRRTYSRRTRSSPRPPTWPAPDRTHRRRPPRPTERARRHPESPSRNSWKSLLQSIAVRDSSCPVATARSRADRTAAHMFEDVAQTNGWRAAEHGGIQRDGRVINSARRRDWPGHRAGATPDGAPLERSRSIRRDP